MKTPIIAGVPVAPNVPTKPAGCGNRDCPHKQDCLRHIHEKESGWLNWKACTKTGYSFQVPVGSPEAAEFEKQLKRIAQEKEPFNWHNDTRGIDGDIVNHCSFCLEAGREHTVTRHGTPESVTPWNYQSVFMRGHIRVCTGCGRWDGPWVPTLEY